jgi:hypothetical protein
MMAPLLTGKMNVQQRPGSREFRGFHWLHVELTRESSFQGRYHEGASNFADLLGTLGGVAALPGAANERERVEQAAHSTVTGLLGVAALWLSVLSHHESGMRVKREREGCAASALRRPAGGQ